MVTYLLKNARQGDPESILSTMDSFARNESWMMNVGDCKGKILDNEVTLAQPMLAVELGAYCGYSAVRIARLLPQGGRLFSLEIDARLAGIAAQVVNAAGLADRVHFLVGPADASMRRLREVSGRDHVDLLFLDHWKDRYLPDIRLAEQLGLLREGSVVVADNVVYPGAPDYLAHVRSHPGFRSTHHPAWLEYRDDVADGVEVSVFLGP